MEKRFYTIEPHGDGYALYAGRDSEYHGYRLCNLSDFDMHKDNTISMIELSLNRADDHILERDELLGRIDRLKDALQWSTDHRTVMIAKLHQIKTIAKNKDPEEACRLIIKECE